MSHQRYPSHDPAKEPHAISLKVLRLSRPSLVTQHPLQPPLAPPSLQATPIPASLAYTGGDASEPTAPSTNPDPFLLSPILNLPLSFGSAYVGEHFSCTLCANFDAPESSGAVPQTQLHPETSQAQAQSPSSTKPKKQIRDVKIEAEMKTPTSGSSGSTGNSNNPQVQKLELTGGREPSPSSATGGVDLAPGETLQRVLGFDLKDEGNHVLAVTVSYYEATETSGRTRTFRKLYQFICKASLIVRTKVGTLPPVKSDSMRKEAGSDGRDDSDEGDGGDGGDGLQRWVLEAQLENCSEDVVQLERVFLELDEGLRYTDCNWGTGGDKPVLHPGEVEQVCFVIEETGESPRLEAGDDGRIAFGVLGIGWRGEMGNRGFLTTGRLGVRVAA